MHTRPDLMKPTVESRVLQKQPDQKSIHHSHSKMCTFIVGQAVLVRNLQSELKWLPGYITEQTGPVSYKVQVKDDI